MRFSKSVLVMTMLLLTLGSVGGDFLTRPLMLS
jgi:hypothetical protein